MPIQSFRYLRLVSILGALVFAAAVSVACGVTDGDPPVCPVSSAHVPDGPDGAGGCWPGPLTTGPTTTPTEVYQPAPAAGDAYRLGAPVTIENKVFNTSILVTGKDVVIKNSLVNGAIEVRDSGSLRLENSKVNGGDWIGYAITGSHYDVIRTDLSGAGVPTICLGDCKFIDTFSHDPHAFQDKDQHTSAYMTVGNDKGPLVLRHNTLWCNIPVNPVGGGCTADVALQANFADVSNVTLDHNLLPVTPSGSYCVTLGFRPDLDTPFSNPTNIVVTNNVFGKGSNGHCGVFGTSDAWRVDGPGHVWSGNVFTDGTPVLPNS